MLRRAPRTPEPDPIREPAAGVDPGSRSSSPRQLAQELAEARRRIAALETAEARLAAAQTALSRSEERYRLLYDNIPLMYFTLDAHGTVLAVNLSGAHDLGYEPEELIGRPVLEVFHPEDHAEVERQLESLLGRPGQVARWEFRKVRKDGSVLWVREAARMVEEDGRPIVLVVCEDVTERKEAEELLARYQMRLRVLSMELSLADERQHRRLAVELHDQVGQTLALAKLHLRDLASRESALQAVGEIARLLDQAIAHTRCLTTELGSPLLYEVGLGAALASLVEQLERVNGPSLEFVGDSEPQGLPLTTRVVLYQVVRELLHNVLKHAHARAGLVALEAYGTGVSIRVEDDGVGFDPAETLDMTGSSRGYGLFSVRERIELLGGGFELDSAPGRGTRVRVRVPSSLEPPRRGFPHLED